MGLEGYYDLATLISLWSCPEHEAVEIPNAISVLFRDGESLRVSRFHFWLLSGFKPLIRRGLITFGMRFSRL